MRGFLRSPDQRQPPPRLRWNVVANVAGRGISALLLVLFVPEYLRLLGLEAYGLVGFYATLQGVLLIFDFGIGVVLNREMAALPADAGRRAGARELVRTLEVLYWATGALLALALWLAAPAVASRWLNAASLPADQMVAAVRLMALAFALQWPFALYQGGLLGIDRQVALNVVRVAGETVRAVGAVAVLAFVSATPFAFFAWHAAASLLLTLAAAVLLWRSLPASARPAAFRARALVSVAPFAASLTAISLVSLLLTQLDKVLLSRLLTLSAFGVYTLATSLTALFTQAASPFVAAIFPRMVGCAERDDLPHLRALYRRGSRAVALLIVPPAVVTAVFARQVLQAWTGDSAVAAAAAGVTTWLAIGYLMHALQQLPYALQLAHGSVRYALWQNACAVVLLVPALLVAVRVHGAAGAAAIWCALNAGALLVVLPLVHRRFLKSWLWEWYSRDVGVTLAATLAVTALWRLALPDAPHSRPVALLLLAANVATAAAVAALLMRDIRQSLLQAFWRVTPGSFRRILRHGN